MRKLAAAIALVTAAACGGGEKNCDFSKIGGTYTVHFDEEAGGTCGPIPDINVLITAGSESASDCTVTNEIKDAAACTEDLDITCPDTADNISLRQVAHLDVQPDGSSFEGTDTIQGAYLSTGATVCISTYKIKYTRQ